MAQNFKDFEGTFPYATELLGVYQPIIGWRSRQNMERVAGEARSFAESVLTGMLADSRVTRQVAATRRAIAPDVALPVELPSWLGSHAADRVEAAIGRFMTANRRMPNAGDWRTLIADADLRLDGLLGGARGGSTPADGGSAAPRPTPRTTAPRPADGSLTAAPARPGLVRVRPTPSHFDLGVINRALHDSATTTAAAPEPTREAVVAGTFQFLADRMPALLDHLIRRPPAWDVARFFTDPLANFDASSQSAVLSPIGLLQIYRQYFFELDSFLGPPVGHVWVSPGGNLEVYEVHTRRTSQERETEQSIETTTRSDTERVDSDELSTAVSQQNGRNMNFGFTANAGFNIGVAQASTSVTLGLQTSHMTAQQEAHKHMRQQSERLSTEIRRRFRTTFRTTVQTEDVASRRYVLANSTDKLLNVELRRKMRRVGVQVQHIGTQLCWQVYIDEAGRRLGVGELVHVAMPTDVDPGVPAPEAPAIVGPRDSDLSVDFPFSSVQDHAPTHDTYVVSDFVTQVLAASNITTVIGVHSADNSIVANRTFTATTPAPGYQLTHVEQTGFDRVDPERDLPSTVDAAFEVTGSDSFTITLRRVNFEHQPAIRFALRLTWEPTDEARNAAEVEYQAKLKDYKQRERRAYHTEYVRAVRERINAAGAVSPRPFADLRAEERAVTYRSLVRRLTRFEHEQGRELHVTSELIRGLFDVDNMLYFVAPDWVQPRRRRYRQEIARRTDRSNNTATITNKDVVAWGDTGDRDNYLITETSEPAPLGASLGWLIQLDGDAHRNAFLNAPWVKAVVPIRPGREAAALRWLKLNHVEGSDGLGERYAGPEPDLAGHSVEAAIDALAAQVQRNNTAATSIAATETVFQNGFDPLAEGFRATGTPYEVFDQWVEVLPTDQIVATDYTPTPERR